MFTDERVYQLKCVTPTFCFLSPTSFLSATPFLIF